MAVKTHELLRQLRELSVAHLRQLWSLSTERRQLSDNSETRRLTQAEWGETKRRLGPTGRNAKRKLMPGWASVAKLPLCKPKRLLTGDGSVPARLWCCVVANELLAGS